MATSISAYFRCSDGTFISLYDSNVTENTTTEITTGGTGLSQVTGVSLGQAYVGKTLTHGVVKVSTEDANTGISLFNYIQTPAGSVGLIVQGAGGDVSQMPPLCKPYRLTQGDTFQARFDAGADAATQMAALSVYCTDGTCDVFFVQIVNNTKTAMVNKDGSSIGQALANKVISKAFATASTDFDINESNAGVGAYYVEAADGSLKAMYPPVCLAGSSQDFPYFQVYPVRILQNDSLSVMGSHS